MPRGSFDTTADLIYGPLGLIPGAVYSTQDCRFVPLLFSITDPIPLTERVGYITLAGPAPSAPKSTSIGIVYTVDYGFADLIAIPHGALPNYRVLFVESVIYRSHDPYYRVHVELF